MELARQFNAKPHFLQSGSPRFGARFHRKRIGRKRSFENRRYCIEKTRENHTYLGRFWWRHPVESAMKIYAGISQDS
jgi:hypothetical protein